VKLVELEILEILVELVFLELQFILVLLVLLVDLVDLVGTGQSLMLNLYLQIMMLQNMLIVILQLLKVPILFI